MASLLLSVPHLPGQRRAVLRTLSITGDMLVPAAIHTYPSTASPEDKGRKKNEKQGSREAKGQEGWEERSEGRKAVRKGGKDYGSITKMYILCNSNHYLGKFKKINIAHSNVKSVP